MTTPRYSREVFIQIVTRKFWKEQPAKEIHVINDNDKECFLLLIEEDGIAFLQGLQGGIERMLVPCGQRLIHEAMTIVKQNGAKRLEITDESRKLLPNGIDLSLMYFLSTGKTWYETYIPGLQPEFPIQMGFWREHATTNTWNDVWNALIRHKPDAILPVDVSDIDTTIPGSAMYVFQRIKDARTEFFVEYDQYLTEMTRVGPLRYSKWYLNF